jgi:hypothetical protein
MKERIPMDQCKRSAESRTLQRLPPFERGEIKALSGEGRPPDAAAGGGFRSLYFRLGRGKKSLWHLLHLILQFIIFSDLHKCHSNFA